MQLSLDSQVHKYDSDTLKTAQKIARMQEPEFIRYLVAETGRVNLYLQRWDVNASWREINLEEPLMAGHDISRPIYLDKILSEFGFPSIEEYKISHLAVNETGGIDGITLRTIITQRYRARGVETGTFSYVVSINSLD